MYHEVVSLFVGIVCTEKLITDWRFLSARLVGLCGMPDMQLSPRPVSAPQRRAYIIRTTSLLGSI